MAIGEQYDERIAHIMSKIEALREREFSITCGEWPPIWKPPMSEKAVAAFEAKHQIHLPADYRRFITTVASSGSQPFYGLEVLTDLPDLSNPFHYTLTNPLILFQLTEEEWDDENEEEETLGGVLTLCTEGCGMDSVLVVNSNDPDTYGTVWYWDFANDFGTSPMIDPKTGRPFHFLDWLEYWADRTAALADDEYFGFAETVEGLEILD